jgi:hypothetical protein
VRISLIARSKLYLNTNYVLTIIPNVSYIYEFSPRRVFRCVQILFGLSKLRRRNSAVKTRSNVIAADLKKLRMREIYKKLNRGALRNKNISEYNCSADANPKRRSEFRNFYKIRLTYSNLY